MARAWLEDAESRSRLPSLQNSSTTMEYSASEIFIGDGEDVNWCQSDAKLQLQKFCSIWDTQIYVQNFQLQKSEYPSDGHLESHFLPDDPLLNLGHADF